jgi:hypothetical protein
MRSGTLLDVLILVVGPKAVLSCEPSERVDEMCAEIWIDVLWGELGGAGAVHRPVSVVAHYPFLGS